MFIASSTEAPQQIDIRKVPGRQLVGEVVVRGFSHAEEVAERAHQSATAQNAVRVQDTLRRQLCRLQRVLEHFGEALRVRIDVGRRVGIGNDRAHVDNEAVAGDFFPLTTQRELVGLLRCEIDRVHVRVPAVRIRMRDFVAPHRTGNLTQHRTRTLAVTTLVQAR